MTKITKLLALLLLAIVPAALLSAQHEHHIGQPQKEAKVKYTIRGTIVPDSSLIHGEMEISFVNYNDSVLSEVCLLLNLNNFKQGGLIERRYDVYEDDYFQEISDDDRPYTKIDSILFRGVPCEDVTESPIGEQIYIKLGTDLSPGEKGHLLLSFTSKIPQMFSKKKLSMTFLDWYPHLYALDVYSFNDYSFGWNPVNFEEADYNLSITIDSSYSVVMPGKLINEKEHFGLINMSRDSIAVEVLNNHSLDLYGEKYVPVYEDGLKKYYAKYYGGFDCPLVVYQDYSFDRFTSDSLIVDVCYPVIASEKWSFKTAEITKRILDSLTVRLGEFPYKKLIIAAVDTTLMNEPAAPIIVIPRKVKNKFELEAFLTLGLVKLYMIGNQTLSEKALCDGMAYYLSAAMLFEQHGSEGYKGLLKYEKRKKKKSSLKYFVRDNKIRNRFMNEIEISDKLIDKDISKLNYFALHKYRIYPSMFAAFRFELGDNSLNEVFKKFVSANVKTLGNLESIINGYVSSGVTFLQVWDYYITPHDSRIVKASFDKINDSMKVSIEVEQDGFIILPFELGFVTTNRDTFYDTISVEQMNYPTEPTIITRTFSEIINAVIIDPNYYLPDTNRYDNYRFRMPVKHSFADPANLFIGFRDF